MTRTDSGPPGGGRPAADPLAAAEESRQTLSGLMFAALAMPPTLRAPNASLPLTVIGGFLGAGKTTLLNHLLGAPGGRRIVVLVNDFGSINIDAALISSRSEDTIGLTNGCACCTVSSDLTKTLIEIAQRDDPPDAIVLEASGLADPQGIAQVALANPAIRLDGMLVLLDAETLHERAGDPQTSRLFLNQLAAADLIVLSKTDLLDQPGRTAALDWLATHFPATPVIEASNGDVPTEVVLSLAASHDEGIEHTVPSDHADGFTSLSFTIDGPLDGERLQEVFDTLPDTLLRAKGVLRLADQPELRTIYDRVGSRWRYTTGEPWGGDAARSSLVFIGPADWIDRSALEGQLEACRT